MYKYIYIYIYICVHIYIYIFLCHVYIPYLRSLDSPHLRSRHTSGRTALHPYGHRGYSFVRIGNVLSSRVALMCLLASMCGLRWILEQPDASFLPNLPRYQWLWGVLKATYLDQNVFVILTSVKFCVLQRCCM